MFGTVDVTVTIFNMPSLKRTYQAGYLGPNKRRRYSKTTINKALTIRRPEVKDVVFSRSISLVDAGGISAAGLFNGITQGVKNSNRIGDRIRVLSIEVAGNVFGISGFSTFSVVCPNRADRVPDVADFGTQSGRLYDSSNGWNLMHYVRDPAALSALQKTVYRFPLGMVVHYDQPSESEPNGNVSKNEVYFCHLPAPLDDAESISYTVRVRFVDV